MIQIFIFGCLSFSNHYSDETQLGGCQVYDPALSPNTGAICSAFVSEEVMLINAVYGKEIKFNT